MKSQHSHFKSGSISKWICVIACLTLFMAINPAQAQRRTPPRTPQQKKTTPKKTPPRTPTPQQRPSRKSTTPPARNTTPKQNPSKVGTDSDLEKKFDEIMHRGQRNTTNPTRRNTTTPRSRTTTPKNKPQTPRSGSTGRRPITTKGKTTAINIPPVSSNTPPEERTYGFSIKGGTYEQLVHGFARQTGLGVLGDTPKDGQVNFVTTEELTFNEALSRIRMLLFDYKPHEPYWLERRDTHLAVVRVTDIYRILPRNRMFQSIDHLQNADVSGEELALVIYTPKKGSVSDLKEVRDFMPDYVRVTPLDGNRVSIFALKKDIDKYLWLIDFFAGERSDPRSLERIKVKFIPPSVAIEKLRQLIPDLGSSKTAGRPRPTPRRGSTPGIDTMPEPDVVIIPEDSHGFMLVRAMQDKIEEIKLMLPFVDTKSSKGSPVMIPVKHGNVEELISTIGQILALTASSDEGSSGGKPSTRARRIAKPVAGEPLTTNDVTLFAHPSGQSIIAIARNEEVIERVRSLVEQFDEPTYVGPERIELKFANPGDVVTTVTAVLGPVNKGKPSPERLHIVADPTGNAIWFTSSRNDAVKVREIIAGIDTENDAIKLHSIQLKTQSPTFVSDILKQYDGSSGGSASPSKGRKRSIVKAPVAKFTPDEGNNRLIVLCTESEWQSYLPIIADLEQLSVDNAPFVRLELQYLDPQSAADQLTQMIGIAVSPKGPVRIIATSNAVLLIGATATQVDDVRAFITEIDKDIEIIQRTFTIQFANIEEIKGAIEQLVGSGQASPRRKPSPGKGTLSTSSASDHLTLLQIGQRLVVRTTPEIMLDVEKIITEFDVETGGTEIRVYDDFPPGADIESITATLTAFVSVSSPMKKGRPQSTAFIKAMGPKFLPQPSAGKLIVIAEPSAFPEIERLLAVLKTEVDHDPINVEFISVTHADPTELIEMIGPMIDIKISHLITVGELAPLDDASSVASPVKRSPRSGSSARKSNRYHIDADIRNNRIVIAAPQLIIDIAKELIAQFDLEGTGLEIVFRTIELTNATASDMVRAIREMRGSSRRRINKPGAPSVKPHKSGSDGLTVVEAPGGSTVVLHGPLDQVDEVTEWIEQLDNQSTEGQTIKVFEIKNADIPRLVELILNVVDSPAGPTKGKAKRPAKRASLETSDDLYETNRTWHGQSIYIQADMIASTMIVATSESKMKRIEKIIFDFDPENTDGPMSPKPMPNFVYELQFVDAFDASWELSTVLGEVWEPNDDQPAVTSTMFGNNLIIKYHDESRFGEIEDIIKRFVDKLSPDEQRVVKKSYATLKGLTAEEIALWMKMTHPEVDIEIINIAEKTVDWGIEQVVPPKSHRNYPCVLPGAFYQMTQTIMTGALGQQKKRSSDDMIRSMLPGSKKDSDSREKPEREGSKRILKGEKLKAYYDSEQGIIIVEGKQALLEDVDDWMDELREEIENLPVKLDIRIYRVKYIGVYEAREIIEEMFNATRQQKGAVQAAQRRQQQMQRQQAIARQRQQQQQNRGGQSDQQGKQRGQQPQAGNTLQLPKEAVRIFANPRDRTLIFRAETSQYPAIEELLATIDQPKPIDSEMHIFKLVKLDALEVEQMLKNLLGLGGTKAKKPAAQQSGTRAAGRNTRSRQSTSKQLPRTIMQEVVGKTGVLGVDPEDINITANEAANSILVMAPRAAIEYIDQIINELESMDTNSDEMRTITLRYAIPSKLAETIGNALSRGPKTKKGKPTGDTRFTLTPHDETKRLFVSARDEMFVRIEKMAKTLDQPQQIGFEMKIYPLKHADARKIHEQMTALMTDYMKRLGKNANRIEPFSVEVDDTTNSLIVMGSPSVFEFIETNLAMVDTPANASSPPSIQIYSVQYADPGIVANIINQWAKSRTQGKGRSAKVSTSNLVIAAAEPVTQSVVVSASEKNHTIIKQLITDLDVAPEGQGVHVLTIENADPQAVAQTLQAIFIQSSGKRGPQKISISSTPGSKSITIKCNNEVLQDIKDVIAQLDTEGINQPKIITLKFAKVGQVLPTLQDMFMSQRGGGGRGKMQPIINGSEAINAIIVRAESMDLSAIESVIVSLDTQEAADKPSFRLIQVKSGINVTNLAEKIERTINVSVSNRPGSGSRGSMASITATPDVRTGTIIIAGTPTLFDEAEKLITSLQDMGPSGGRVTRVIPVSRVSIDDVQRLINQLTGDSSSGGRSRRATGSRSGRSRRSGSNSPSRRPRTSSSPRRGRP